MSGAVQYLSIGAVEGQMDGSVRPQVPAAFQLSAPNGIGL